MTNKFEYAIAIKPLGLLYGSSGGFLSPENLVGRSATKFPPDATTLSGVYAAHYKKESTELKSLQLAGNFWSYWGQEHDFYVPTPFNCLVREGKIVNILQLQGDKWRLPNGHSQPVEKYTSHSWLALSQWHLLQNLQGNNYPVDQQGHKIKVKSDPWKALPHLHPRLEENARTVKQDANTNQGSLFLENAIQLENNVCLIYLANIPLPDGWYRFGGEGHVVEITSHSLTDEVKNLLDAEIGYSFALISPAVWGTNRLSYRTPIVRQQQENNSYKIEPLWNVKAAISDRPRTFRYRLGEREGQTNPRAPKVLSRGRYAVPAGSVYVLEEKLPSWYEWEEGEQQWFPREGYSLKRWGCSLALPLVV